MALFAKKSPWIKEWEDLEKREAKFIEKRINRHLLCHYRQIRDLCQRSSAVH